jgi:hypothetical protein
VKGTIYNFDVKTNGKILAIYNNGIKNMKEYYKKLEQLEKDIGDQPPKKLHPSNRSKRKRDSDGGGHKKPKRTKSQHILCNNFSITIDQNLRVLLCDVQ